MPRLSLVILLLLVGCGDSSNRDPATDGGSSARRDSGPPGMVPPGSGDDECGRDVATLMDRAASTAETGATTFVTGFFQVSSIDQDAYLARLDEGEVTWCRIYSEEPPDERGILVHVDAEGRLFAAFTTDGGNTGFRATNGAHQRSYGMGGGPKVSYVARVDATDGAILAATFIHSTLMSGRSNTLTVSAIGADGDDVVVDASAFFTPPLEPPGACEGDSPFAWTGRYDLDFTTLRSGTAPGCGP